MNLLKNKKAEWESWLTGVELKKPEQVAPASFELEQNYPNPFNPVTTIKYQLQKDARVELQVFDVIGRKVQTLVKTNQPAGFHEVKFDGKGLASGVYICSLKVDKQQVQNIRMLLLK